jgi:hypothetical protein
MNRRGQARHRFLNERGVALVEFALILPAFCLLLFGMLDFGRAINYWLDANHLANEGARWVVVNKDTGPLPAYLRSQADTEELRSGGTDSVPTPLQVAVCYPNGAVAGERVIVQTTVVYNWLPVLDLDVANSTLTGSASMRLEQIPTNHPATGTCA